MSDIDLDGIADALPDGCLTEIFVNAWDMFPVPTTLTIGSMIAHSQMNETAPILHGIQDVIVYYGGAALMFAGHRAFGTPDTKRNRLLTAFAGAALFATSFFLMPNYLEKPFGKKDAKTKTEQTTPKTDSTKRPQPGQW